MPSTAGRTMNASNGGPLRSEFTATTASPAASTRGAAVTPPASTPACARWRSARISCAARLSWRLSSANQSASVATIWARSLAAERDAQRHAQVTAQRRRRDLRRRHAERFGQPDDDRTDSLGGDARPVATPRAPALRRRCGRLRGPRRGDAAVARTPDAGARLRRSTGVDLQAAAAPRPCAALATDRDSDPANSNHPTRGRDRWRCRLPPSRRRRPSRRSDTAPIRISTQVLGPRAGAAARPTADGRATSSTRRGRQRAPSRTSSRLLASCSVGLSRYGPRSRYAGRSASDRTMARSGASSGATAVRAGAGATVVWLSSANSAMVTPDHRPTGSNRDTARDR